GKRALLHRARPRALSERPGPRAREAQARQPARAELALVSSPQSRRRSRVRGVRARVPSRRGGAERRAAARGECMKHAFSRTTVVSSWIVLLALGALCQIAIKYAGLETGPFDFSPHAFAAAAASPWLWAAVLCYVGEFVAWMVILRHSSLSSAF